VDSPSTVLFSPMSTCGGSAPNEDGYGMPGGNSRYCLVASKQMVGIYLTVWVKGELKDHVRNMKVSCVGRGLMGYLGNKVNLPKFCFFIRLINVGGKWWLLGMIDLLRVILVGFCRVPSQLVCLCMKQAFALSVVI
jgi:hypothetical protein